MLAPSGSKARLFFVYTVVLGYLPEHAAGVTDGDDPGWYVPRHHAARADDRAFAYCHAGQDGDISAYPDVVANDDGRALFKSGVALGGKQGMDGRVHPAVGADKAVRAEAYRRAVHEIRAVVYEAVVTNIAVDAVVDEKGSEYADIVSHIRQQLAQYSRVFLRLGERRKAQPAAKLLGRRAQFGERFVIVCVVPQALFHFFAFSHGKSP